MEENKVYYEKKNVRDAYIKRYSGFEALPSFKTETQYLRKIAANIAKNYAIDYNQFNTYLDLGCGLGIKTAIFSNFFTTSMGIDFVDNAIQIATLLNDNEKLTFKTIDVTEQNTIGKWNFITAFGLSLFNTHDVTACINEIKNTINTYATDKAILVIGSFTDFSGKAPTQWVNHSRNDLTVILRELNAVQNYSATIYFPHKDPANYFGSGALNFLTEWYKLIFTKRRYYYIVVKINCK